MKKAIKLLVAVIIYLLIIIFFEIFFDSSVAAYWDKLLKRANIKKKTYCKS